MQSIMIDSFLRGRGYNYRVKRQKLLYYAQAWHLAWYGRPLFEDQIQAWRMGPVAVEAWRHSLRTPRRPRSEEPDWVTAHLDAICGYYGRFTGTALAEKTHNEDPWIKRWDQATKNNVIDRSLIMQYFSKPGIEGPVRPQLGTQSVDDVELDAVMESLRPRLAGVDKILAAR